MPRTPFDHDDPPRSAGYGRPPAEHRIQPGEVRNPHGRRGKPKPKIDFLDETVSITMSGERLQVTRRESLEYFLYARAAKGDVRAIGMLEARERQRTSGLPEEATLTGDEQRAFDRFVRDYAKQLPDEDPT